MGSRRVLIGVAAFAGLAALTIGLLTAVTRRPGDAVRRASAAGGFALEVPKRWVVDTHQPSDPDHMEFMTGHENAALGFLQRGGFWVARWSAPRGASVATLADEQRVRQRKSPRADWSLAIGALGRRAAVVEKYAEPASGIGERMRLGPTRLVVYEFVTGGFVYQFGHWSLPRAGDTARRLEDIGSSLRVSAPRPWMAKLTHDAGRVRLPGGWTQQPTTLDGATFFALAPGDPAAAWVYLFHYEESPAASLETAKRSITQHGGSDIRETEAVLHKQRVARLDFAFPDEDRRASHDTEWFVSDGSDGTFVFAVGIRAGANLDADEIVAGWRR